MKYHKHVRSNKVVIQISLKLQNAPKSNYYSQTLSKGHQKHNKHVHCNHCSDTNWSKYKIGVTTTRLSITIQ
jgi:hypothetical protein